MMKYARFLIAIFILPFVAAFVSGLVDAVISFGKSASDVSIPFWLGLGSYFVFQAVFFKPVRTYVFGHELTHAIAGLLSGARVKSFKVSSSGGSVVLSRTGVFIALSPYFVPIYTVILILVYKIYGAFGSAERLYPYFLFLCGFSISFHFGLTYYALSQGQSDLKVFGVFFSSVLILLVNCIVIMLFMKLLFPSLIDLKKYFLTGWGRSLSNYFFIYERMLILWGYFQKTR
ncbi:MAG: hypothetical protein JW803_01235 [Endomicrobiales bacterium]|nr:hypothetical protein [Endomicrobiales bacterium]